MALTDKTNYTYTNRNLLQNPEYYMYSSFVGIPFLADYVADRTQCIEFIESRYQLLLTQYGTQDVGDLDVAWLETLRLLSIADEDILSAICHTMHSNLDDVINSIEDPANDCCNFTDLEELNVFNTDLALQTILECVVNHTISEDKIAYVWLSRFLKKFEVYKRLREAYTSDMRSASSNYSNLLNYALLSVGILYYYGHTGNLKMLNGSLKLNDLLCSNQDCLESPRELLLTIVALRKELYFVRKLSVVHGCKF